MSDTTADRHGPEAIIARLLEGNGRLRAVLDEAGNHFDHDNPEAARQTLARYFRAPVGSCLDCRHRRAVRRGVSVECAVATTVSPLPWEAASVSFECPDFARGRAAQEGKAKP